MYTTVQFLHSYWAYLVLLVLIVTTINSLMGFFSKREYGAKDMRLALFTLITMHIQLLIGLVLWFVSPRGMGALGEENLMKDSSLRSAAIEHPLLMIIAVVLITIGYSKHKKQRLSTPKFKKLAIFYTIGLVAVLAIIPWSEWF
ncbi:MAG: hypothetical protein CL867_04620 [Cytophagaceae bacterium]|nr:hypothetical protein [Cytophagaceae bacterium]